MTRIKTTAIQVFMSGLSFKCKTAQHPTNRISRITPLAQPRSGSSSKCLVLRLLPTLLEMLLPVHCPGTAEVIDEPRFPEDQLCRPAIRTIDDGALDAALH